MLTLYIGVVESWVTEDWRDEEVGARENNILEDNGEAKSFLWPDG